MKHTKKLIPALGMLLLSACMLVTSTFAWFAMNENVTATGMTVTAKGNQVYLQIVSGKSADGTDVWANKNGQALPSATATNNFIKGENNYEGMLPVNVVAAVTNTEGETTIGEGESAQTIKTYSNTAYTGGGTFKWVSSVGYSNTNGVATTEYTDVTNDANGNNGKYFLMNTFSIRMDPTAGAASAGGPLAISSIATTAGNTDAFKGCLNVLVVSTINGTAYGQVWAYNGTSFAKAAGNDFLSNGNFTAAQPAVVEIYVFFNGDDADCTQAALAAAATAAYDVTVNFTVQAQSQGN